MYKVFSSSALDEQAATRLRGDYCVLSPSKEPPPPNNILWHFPSPFPHKLNASRPAPVPKTLLRRASESPLRKSHCKLFSTPLVSPGKNIPTGFSTRSSEDRIKGNYSLLKPGGFLGRHPTASILFVAAAASSTRSRLLLHRYTSIFLVLLRCSRGKEKRTKPLRTMTGWPATKVRLLSKLSAAG